MSAHPTFGYLASLVPEAKKREVLHVASAGELVEGKIAVTHRSPYPVKIRIGISSGSLTQFTSDAYILYDRQIEEGESYESDFIYYADGQSLIVYSDTPNTNFIIHGQAQADPTNSGFVSSLQVAQENQKQILYTVPGDEEALVSIFATNQSPSQARFRIAISDNGLSFNQSEYIEFNTDLNPRSSYQRTSIKIRGGQSIVVFADNTGVSFSAYAKFNYSVVSTDFTIGGNLQVGNDASLLGDLLVSGVSTFSDSVTFSEDVNFDSDISLHGLLRGYTSGNSIAYTLSNSTGNISTIGSLTSGNGVFTGGNLQVGINKFTVDPTNGNINTTGTLSVNGGVAGNLNLLNNKVTNLAEPSVPSDAATRRYVDGKITALSIALG